MSTAPSISCPRQQRQRWTTYLLVSCVGSLICGETSAQETEVRYLSGTGRSDRVAWEFRCDHGRRCGEWTTIPVPSQWELEGFGTYSYGREERRPYETGWYRYDFEVPKHWAEMGAVELVFGGVMTDAEVRVNGLLAGPEHRGGFTEFAYDVTELLRFGEKSGPNRLEVRVRERSTYPSVNRAERDADYWLFGGIYRPVWLRALPATAIRELAIDARHDGTLRVQTEVQVNSDGGPLRLVASVRDLAGKAMAPPVSTPVPTAGRDGTSVVTLETVVESVAPWSAERPARYDLVLELRAGEQVRHRVRRRIGFRTVEVLPGKGIAVNGSKVRLWGVNRHAFWPESGRTLDAADDRRDAAMIEALGMNAVRTSHYPPDPTFLDTADRLGLYVIDELPGWHDAYSTAAGARLVAEMVRRDRHHPSVILWANGNEGGWNRALDPLFAAHDPQRRPVLHPHAPSFGGLDTEHYPTWEELRARLEGTPGSWRERLRRRLGGEELAVMPTEMLHGLYDGGGGAGFEAYRRLLAESARGAGAFLWAFLDEAVVWVGEDGVRGRLDAHGNFAPDGVVGPYRAPEGSFHAIREILTPVAIGWDDADGPRPATTGRAASAAVRLDNHFDVTDLGDCTLRWSWLDLPPPGGGAAAYRLRASGALPAPAAPPDATATLDLPPPPGGADALRLEVSDPNGRTVASRLLLARRRPALAAALRARASSRQVGLEPASAASDRSDGSDRSDRSDADGIVLAAGEMAATFDSRSGLLRALRRGDAVLELAGPAAIGLASGRPPAAPPAVARDVGRDRAPSLEVAFDVGPEGGVEHLTWRLDSAGWLHLHYRYRIAAAAGEGEPPDAPVGVAFDLPGGADAITSVRWLGAGPARVWHNRRHGGPLDVWLRRGPAPALAGFYAGSLWAELGVPGGQLLLSFEGEDELALGVGTTRFPADARYAVAAVPGKGAFQLLHRIGAIGTKFHPAAALGPAGAPPPPEGVYEGAVALRLAAP